MSKQALIYERALPVTKGRHRNISVNESHGYGFAQGINAVPLTAVEFASTAVELPIVFARSGEGCTATAMLGLRNNENLMVDENGAWRGRAIPAFLRRYPFVFAHDPQAQKYTLCIDEASDFVAEGSAGNRLFDEAGGETDFLRRMFGFVAEWQRAYQTTQRFCARLQDLGLLDDSEIKFVQNDGKTAVLRGFAAVDETRLNALDGETVGQLFRSGELKLIYAHLMSLRNLDALAAQMPAQDRMLN